MNIDKDLVWDRESGMLTYQDIQLTYPKIPSQAKTQKEMIDALMKHGVGVWFLSPFEGQASNDKQLKSITSAYTARMNKRTSYLMKWTSKCNGLYIKAELIGLALERYEKDLENFQKNSGI